MPQRGVPINHDRRVFPVAFFSGILQPDGCIEKGKA
jgi:hypothetical protein